MRQANAFSTLTLFAAVASASCALPTSAAANGEFLQFDYAPRASSATATVRREQATLTLGWSEFDSGSAVNVWGNYGLPLPAGAWFRAGPALRVDDDGKAQVGARFGVEKFYMNERLTAFLLAEFNTIQNEYLALGQIGHRASGIAGEVAFQGNDAGFREITLAVSYRIAESPVRLRLGYRTNARVFFAGVTINTF